MSDDRVELERLPPPEDAPLVRPGYPRVPAYYEGSPYGYGQAYNEDEGDSIHLREVWRIIRKRRWLILAVTVIVTTLVTIEAYRTKSTYKASAFIEIGKDSPTVRSAANGMVIQGDDDLYYPQLSINTNLFRLTSEPLLEDVAADSKLDKNSKFGEPPQRSFLEAVQAMFKRATFKKPDPEPVTDIGTLVSANDDKHAFSVEDHERLRPYVLLVAAGLQAEQVTSIRSSPQRSQTESRRTSSIKTSRPKPSVSPEPRSGSTQQLGSSNQNSNEPNKTWPITLELIIFFRLKEKRR